MFSALALLLPSLMSLIKTSYSFFLKATIECLWWFSLNLLVNEILTYFIWDRLLPSKGITASKLLRDLVSFILIIITIAAIFHFVFEKSVVGIFTASGVMAIILGYSAQATLGEAFAGVGLNITKQFDQGDWINVNGNSGKVVDVNWRFVNLMTKDGNYLSIPNSQITKANIINYSRPDPLHGISIKIPMKQHFSPEIVKKMLITAADQCALISDARPPFAVLSELGGDGSTHHIYYLTYFTTSSAAAINDQILSNVWYQCQRYEQHIGHTTRPELPNYSSEDIMLFLQKMDLFSSLTAEELTQLAGETRQIFYGPPERLLAQGQKNQSLFLIFKGGVDVYLNMEKDEITKVASLETGHYFGEMSLLTGEPAGASIFVNTESTILEVTHDSMAKLFESRPELVEKISSIIVTRKLHNENVRASLTKDNKSEKLSLVSQLANRIKSFFKKMQDQGEQ
ncbi:mechanosensitive ion channel domain-containing protein [Legionella sp. km772]|uniref:mechanosensitive ion channel domain-containing protein n=1 Tax=Legionella sp. km772 TaxID=2498111 RepID=UPI000F8F0679|nr:mechanosensitive ion channel family protein [Legionella sp. km772]RUR05553.1 mechanosensitive ion channel [Legionella sp. km772]